MASRSGCLLCVHTCMHFFWFFSHWLWIDGLFCFGLPFSSTVNSDRAVTLCLIFDLVCTVSCVCVFSPSQRCVHAGTAKPPRTDTVPGFVTRILPFYSPAILQLSLTLLTPTSPSLTHSQTHTHTLYPLLALLGIPPGTNFPTFLPVLLAPVCSVSLC